MKMKEVKELTPAELDLKVQDLRKEHFSLRQQAKTGTLENTARIRQVRKDIARCLTEKTIRSAAKV
ncbi:MAG: 50S ribosomal protein L29 [Lentisphaeria bacterium]|jgi:large subunit ribosomal protein L29|nr:50S ribosomal protein L29 [Lentisphaerota bacterium]MBQ9772143.1 50S ribosomal protein L29 [Lentisphaeria bacterium]